MSLENPNTQDNKEQKSERRIMAEKVVEKFFNNKRGELLEKLEESLSEGSWLFEKEPTNEEGTEKEVTRMCYINLLTGSTGGDTMNVGEVSKETTVEGLYKAISEKLTELIEKFHTDIAEDTEFRLGVQFPKTTQEPGNAESHFEVNSYDVKLKP